MKILLLTVYALLCLLLAPGNALAQATNSPPRFPTSETGARSVAENTSAAMDIGLPVSAMDADNDSLTYTLDASEDAAAFSIVASSGQLRTKAPLDHETKASYTFSVSVSDLKDDSGNPDMTTDDTVTVTITITNVDEPGTAQFLPTQIRVGEVVRVFARDPDSSPVGYVGWYSYNWYRSSDKTTWTLITYEGSNIPYGEIEYTPTSQDQDMFLRVRVEYDKYPGNPDTKTVEVVSDSVGDPPAPAPQLEVIELITGLTIPWDLAFTPDGTILFTERGGR